MIYSAKPSDLSVFQGTQLPDLRSLNYEQTLSAEKFKTDNNHESEVNTAEYAPKQAFSANPYAPPSQLSLINSRISDYKTRLTKSPALNIFGTDITLKALEDLLPPIIGREKEIERAIQILSRRNKSNPIIIGEAGVGKTSIVEGIAHAIAREQVPNDLSNLRIITLDLTSLVASTMYRGQFEERIKAIIKESIEDKNTLLFIDEIHLLVGGGQSTNGQDFSNLFKPALSRPGFRIIGATTLDEYRKHIEKDAALERRFMPIIVEATTKGETLDILCGLRDLHEKHHKVRYTFESLVTATALAARYLPYRQLPDSAIDLIDEAGSLIRIETDKRALIQFPEHRLSEYLSSNVTKYFPRSPDPDVTSDAIRQVVGRITGIPVTRLKVTDKERLLTIEERLNAAVLDQEEAVSVVARSRRRAAEGLNSPERPNGVFVFAGPTGVGKTLLAKALCVDEFGSEDYLTKIDMSEYMEKHSVSRLVGAPPGYIGYNEGGQLTEAVRHKPYSVILLDEIEKAHPDVFNILLQVMEEGRLTDGSGHKVDFRNTLLIMTSNIGFNSTTQGNFGLSSKVKDAITEERVLESMEKYFRPEFLNRVDNVVVFNTLKKESGIKILDLELDKVKERLAQANNTSMNLQPIKLQVSLEAKEWLVNRANWDYGARDLRRLVETYIINPLSELLIKNEITAGDTIELKIEDNKLKLLQLN